MFTIHFCHIAGAWFDITWTQDHGTSRTYVCTIWANFTKRRSFTHAGSWSLKSLVRLTVTLVDRVRVGWGHPWGQTPNWGDSGGEASQHVDCWGTLWSTPPLWAWSRYLEIISRLPFSFASSQILVVARIKNIWNYLIFPKRQETIVSTGQVVPRTNITLGCKKNHLTKRLGCKKTTPTKV